MIRNLFGSLCVGLVLVIALWSNISFANNNEAALEAFKEWFVENGGMVNGIDLAHFPNMGNGILAKNSIPADRLVLKIPHHLIFSYRSLQQLASGNEEEEEEEDDKEQDEEVLAERKKMKDRQRERESRFSNDYVELNLLNKFFNKNNKQNQQAPGGSSASGQELLLTAWLLRESKLGDRSFYAPYLKVLPKYVSSALYFNEKEIDELQFGHVKSDVKDFQKKTKEEYKSFQEIVKGSQGLFPAFEGLSYDEFLWAATIIHSRGLRFRGEIYLSPYADMFNYEPHRNFRHAASGEFFLKHHVLHEDEPLYGDGISIYADRETLANKQLFEDYGDNPNEIYLKYHGFVPNDNPFHCLNVHFQNYQNKGQPMELMKSLTQAQRELLTMLRFPIHSSMTSCIDRFGSMSYSKQFEVYMTILSFNEEETQQCHSLLKSAQPQQQGQQPTISWPVIYRRCGFEKISKKFQDFQKLTSSGTGSGNSKSAITVFTNDVSNTQSSEVSTEMPLETRVLSTLQSMISTSIQSLKLPTSLTHDEELLTALESELLRHENSDNNNEDDLKSILHRYIAVKYRVMNKRLFGRLCELYHVADCGEKISHAALAAATASTPAATETTPTKATETAKTVEEKPKTTDTVKEPTFQSSRPRVAFDLYGSRDSATIDQDLEDFNTWFLAHSPSHHKIKAVSMPIYRIGTIASEEITENEIYLGVPDDIILSGDSAYYDTTSEVSELLHALSTRYQGRRDDFHELLISLIYETFINYKSSKYYPYLHLLPRLSELDVPILWDPNVYKKRLSTSHILPMIANYQYSVDKKFEFFDQIPEIHQYFTEKWNFPLTKDVYRWANAILDSRSIWWGSKRHLVPMLDFINCRENPRDPSRVHSTVLDDSQKYAITKSGKYLLMID